MKTDQVPQDNIASYGGHKKVVYAVDEAGHYQSVQSSGWDVEGFATQMALDDLAEQLQARYQEVKEGKVSPLAYHMIHARLDLPALKQMTGFWGWQIRRHLKPKHFQQLNEKTLACYSQVLGISVAELKQLPEQP